MSSFEASVEFSGRALVAGQASGEIVHCDTPLSFWGGVDSETGQIIDQHHPLSGKTLAGKILVIPGGRGSSSGSSVILELILNGNNPSALIFGREEGILTLGVIIADEMFGKSIPVIRLDPQEFKALAQFKYADISGNRVTCGMQTRELERPIKSPRSGEASDSLLELSESDLQLLDGANGPACKLAMKVVCRVAELYGATRFVDVTRAHIDGCVYTGPGGLEFARQLKEMGARVAIPTTLNAISIDRKRWRDQGVDPIFADAAGELAETYVQMGCEPTFTCAPYLLDNPPREGEQIVWAESNAVVFANSVLGARSLKYPDFLDICIAITGRAPYSGCHVRENRHAGIVIDVKGLDGIDDAFFPLLGYQAGKLAGNKIPLLTGLESFEICTDDLKAFGAAFATTSSAPMFHIQGVTPEADMVSEAIRGRSDFDMVAIVVSDLINIWQELNSASQNPVDMISLGNPHFSLSECTRLRDLCRGRVRHDQVRLIVTCSGAIFDEAQRQGMIDELERFGAEFVTDTCWCMISDPLIPPDAKTLMTNSAKYAHYGPGLTGRKFRFGSLSMCVEAACSGSAQSRFPPWLA
ncbi:MAG: aconitase family protein [Rhizobiaceae bacterium]